MIQRTPEQQQAISSRARHICVDAGAGSGKTRVLIERIVAILDERSVELDAIVAITFTEKAAAEMKARLRLAFREKAPDDDPQELNFWRGLERRMDNARISTIHAFCISILRENALYLDLDPDFEVLAEAESALLKNEAVKAALERCYEAGDEAALSVGATMNPRGLNSALRGLLGQAGLLDRIGEHHPLEDPDALYRVWCEHIDAEQDRRLLSLRHDPTLMLLGRQLDALAGNCTDPGESRETKRANAVAGIAALRKAATAKGIEAAIALIQFKPDKRASKKPWTSDAAYEETEKVLKKVSDLLKKLDPKAYSEEDARAAAALTAQFHNVYQQALADFDAAKQAANVLDFDDLIRRTWQVLRDKPELRARVAAGISHLLIDEFQDTDGAQLEIARLLSDEPNGPALFIVGDAKQSIYYFRGAEVEVFEAERDRADEVVRLDQNFRSLPGVIGFVNDFFLRSGLLDVLRPYEAMKAHRDTLEGEQIEVLYPLPDEDAKWTQDECRRIEAEFVAGRLLTLAEEGITYDKVALLFRRMTHVEAYEEALRRAGIPYAVVAGSGFYEKQEVIDVLNLLKVVVNPYDAHALLAFLRGPLGRLSDESLFRLGGKGLLVEHFLEHTIPEGFAQAREFEEAHALIDTLRGKAALPLVRFMHFLLEHTDLEAIALSQYLGIQKAQNLRKLADLAEAFSRSRPPSLQAFIQYLDSIRRQPLREGESLLQPEGAGAVTLMTVHKAKGLEYPVVFLPDISRKTRDSRSSDLSLHRSFGMALKGRDAAGDPVPLAIVDAIAARVAAEESAEQARLLYVAMTRAKDRLILCGLPNAETGSWFSFFQEIFHLDGAAHGAVVCGQEWRMRIHREAPPLAARARQTNGAPLPERGAIARRIGPVPASQMPRKTFSISFLLDHLAGGVDSEQERTEADPGSRQRRTEAMLRGTLVHRMFELWDFAGNAPPDLEALVREARLGLARRANSVAELTSIAKAFQGTDLCQAMVEAESLWREAPFLLNAGEALISGTIDALLGDGTIIDYKTGRITPERNARYEWQLLLYGAAVRELPGITPKRGLLWYVDAQEAHEIELGPDECARALEDAVKIIRQLSKRPAEASAS